MDDQISSIHTSRIHLLIDFNGSWRELFEVQFLKGVTCQLKVSMNMVVHCKLILYVTLQGQHWKRRSFHLRHGPNQILHVVLEPVKCSWWFIDLFCTLGGAYSSGTCRCRWHPCRYHGGSSSMLFRRVCQSSWPQMLCGQVISQKLVSPADSKISFEMQAGVWESGLPGMWEDNLATLVKCSSTININICPLQNEIESLVILFLKRLPTTWRKLLTVSLRQARCETSDFGTCFPSHLFVFEIRARWWQMIALDYKSWWDYLQEHSSGKACDG